MGGREICIMEEVFYLQYFHHQTINQKIQSHTCPHHQNSTTHKSGTACPPPLNTEKLCCFSLLSKIAQKMRQSYNRAFPRADRDTDARSPQCLAYLKMQYWEKIRRILNRKPRNQCSVSGSTCFWASQNLYSNCFVTSFGFLSLKNVVNVPSKSNKQENFFFKLVLVGVFKIRRT